MPTKTSGILEAPDQAELEPRQVTSESDPAKVTAGRQLFNATCTGYCHGRDGLVGRTPSLRDRTDLSAEEIRDTITNGRREPGKIMPAWKGQLTPEQIFPTHRLHRISERCQMRPAAKSVSFADFCGVAAVPLMSSGVRTVQARTLDEILWREAFTICAAPDALPFSSRTEKPPGLQIGPKNGSSQEDNMPSHQIA